MAFEHAHSRVRETLFVAWFLQLLTPPRMCLSLLLSTLETTIISTALVSITDALKGFSQRDWAVTSYLLTYTGWHGLLHN
jgi:hypothetical protein